MKQHEHELFEELVAAGYHPIVASGDKEGYRNLYESEGWYPGCEILVPDGEYSDKLTGLWYECTR